MSESLELAPQPVVELELIEPREPALLQLSVAEIRHVTVEGGGDGEPTTYEALAAHDDVGPGADQVARGNHEHTGTYEPADETLLRTGDLTGSGSADTPARSDHDHEGVYDPAGTAASAAGAAVAAHESAHDHALLHGHANKATLDAVPNHAGAGDGQALTVQEDGSLAWEAPAGDGEPTTYEALAAHGDVGPGADQAARGDHNHEGVYDPTGTGAAEASAAVSGHESAHDHDLLHTRLHAFASAADHEGIASSENELWASDENGRPKASGAQMVDGVLWLPFKLRISSEDHAYFEMNAFAGKRPYIMWQIDSATVAQMYHSGTHFHIANKANGGELRLICNNGSDQFCLTCKADGAIKLANGASVDTIETSLTDDDAHLPTSSAVIDALAAKASLLGDTFTGDVAIDKATGNINFYIKQNGVIKGVLYFRASDGAILFRSYAGKFVLVGSAGIEINNNLDPAAAGVDLGAIQELDQVYCVALTESSDGRLKEPVGAALGSELLSLLSPRLYRRLDEIVPATDEEPERVIAHQRWHHGLWAQELVWALEQLGIENPGQYGLWVEKPDGSLALRYTQLVPTLIQGWQEQQEKIEALREREAFLQAQIDALAARLEDLEAAS